MTTALLPKKEMEQARLKRDAAYDGLFYICVKTTGIFCRTICPAKSPLAKNIEYLPTAAAALFAGYRPCKRCRPMATSNQPDWAVKLLQEVEAEPTLRITEGDLHQRGIDPATVRRHFLKHYGMTFQAYCRARRLSSAFSSIRNGHKVDEAIMDSGYESHSGFREAFTQLFGHAPKESINGECIVLSWLESPLGPLVAGANKEGICLLEFSDRRMLETQFKTVKKLFKVPVMPGTNRHLKKLQEELSEYFVGKLKKFSVPLVFPGTEFQCAVWKGLLTIPYGQTWSYQRLASKVGDMKAVRAVGRANGMNRISIIIPCHRVVNKDGSLGGYGGGLRRKEFLLNLERNTLI